MSGGIPNKSKYSLDEESTLRRSKRKTSKGEEGLSGNRSISTSRIRKIKVNKTRKDMHTKRADGTSLGETSERANLEDKKGKKMARWEEFDERSACCNDAARPDQDGKSDQHSQSLVVTVSKDNGKTRNLNVGAGLPFGEEEIQIAKQIASLLIKEAKVRRSKKKAFGREVVNTSIHGQRDSSFTENRQSEVDRLLGVLCKETYRYIRLQGEANNKVMQDQKVVGDEPIIATQDKNLHLPLSEMPKRFEKKRNIVDVETLPDVSPDIQPGVRAQNEAVSPSAYSSPAQSCFWSTVSVLTCICLLAEN